jgi:hypothetical protein
MSIFSTNLYTSIDVHLYILKDKWSFPNIISFVMHCVSKRIFYSYIVQCIIIGI